MKKLIYFLCTGNSCRSQMAEGYAKHIFADQAEIFSAGIEAHGKNPKAIQVMMDDGIDISDQESSVIDLSILARADYAITLCGNADERCPIMPTRTLKIHWGFDDPAKAEGTVEEVLSAYKKVRDDIKKCLQQFKL